MESVSFFKSMTQEQKNAIAAALISVKFAKGSIIVNEGDRADSFYVIKKGTVVISKAGKELR